jgi:glycerol-3-phosphate O-acyltransferase
MDILPVRNITSVRYYSDIFRLRAVVAGDNLRIPLLGQFLQGAGAFYIRRAWGDDALYATVVQAYIDILLSKGYNFECFIEGTRSRTGGGSMYTISYSGKLLVPKVGMLRLLCNTILREKASDCWILPVSVQYDRVIETETYVDELLGKPKEKESLRQLVTGGGSKLQLKLGAIFFEKH